METDASNFALGCVLSQFKDKRLHPVAFHSRKLSDAERNYEIQDKELLAILEAFKEWPHYLVGTKDPITVYTDHQNLQNVLTTKVCNQRQIRLGQQLANYNFKIVYRPGKRGGKPDALSRQPEYRPEEGATHREQSILKPDHFQISLVQIGHNQEDEGYESHISEQDYSLRIKLLSSKAKMPTKGSRMAAGYDLYAMDEVLIPAKGQKLVDTGLAVGLPRATYARIAPQSGLANKKKINVGGSVIDANYIGDVKVILMNHGTQDCLIQAGERIAKIFIQKINTETAVQVVHLANTDRGTKGFGSTDLNPRQTIKTNQSIPQISFLQANHQDNEYFDNADLARHLRAQRNKLMMTNAVITKVNMRKYNTEFIEGVHEASKEDQEW